MTDDDDTGSFTDWDDNDINYINVIESAYDIDISEPSVDKWKNRDVENSVIAYINQLFDNVNLNHYVENNEVLPDPESLEGLEGFDHFILSASLSHIDGPDDQNPDNDDSVGLSPITWSLLLKWARDLPSDEKLEFYLKGREDVTEMAGFDSVDDVPRKSTFWRAYADTDSNSPRLDEEAVDALKSEAQRLVNHAKWYGYKIPDSAEDHLLEFSEQGKTEYMKYMEDAERIAHNLLEKALPYIALDRDLSRTTYSFSHIVRFLAHLALERAYPENGSETFNYMGFSEKGSIGADNFYYHIQKRSYEEWFNCFLQANAELLEEVRQMGYLENANEVGLDTTGIPWYGKKSNSFVDGTKPSRNFSDAFHFTTVGVVDNEASLSLAARYLKNRRNKSSIVRSILQQVQGIHYFSNNQLDVNIKRVYLDKGFYDEKSVTALRDANVDFLIQAQKIEAVRNVIDNLDHWGVEWGILQNYSINGLTPGTNIFIWRSTKKENRYSEGTNKERKKYGRWQGFVTDLDPVTANLGKLARRYEYRWGVESQYRQFKNEFYPPTKSPNGNIRTFNFNLAQLFYNIWVVINLQLQDKYDNDNHRLLTADDVLHVIRDNEFDSDI